MPGDVVQLFGDNSSPSGGGGDQNIEQGDSANADQQVQGAATSGGGTTPGFGPSSGEAAGGGGPPPTDEAGGGGDSGLSSINNQGTSAGGALADDSPVYTDGPTEQGGGGQTSGGGGGGVQPKPVATNTLATAAAAIRLAAKKHGQVIPDALIGMMLAQVRGESAFGVTGTLGGTNNWGAAQATTGFANKYKGQAGYGAIGHKDSDPNRGAYLGFYWIAPSQAAAAEEWLFGNWWGPKLIEQNPSSPTEYASILYAGGYFGGVHAGDTKHDPTSVAGAANVADYVRLMGNIPSPASFASGGADPTKVTANPKAFASLSARGITSALFDAASGGAWRAWLPSSWTSFQSSNGVVWFGPPPGGSMSTLTKVGLAVAGAAFLLFGGWLFFLRKKSPAMKGAPA